VVIIEREKTVNSDIDPINFERPLSQAYWFSKRWSRELPDSEFLDGLRAMRPFEPETIEQTSRAGLEGLCGDWVTQPTENVSFRQVHKKQLKGFIAYRDNIWDRALEARSHHDARVHKQPKLITRLEDEALNAQSVLRGLEAMLKDQDEPDFLHRPTKYAYDNARQIIEGAYTHYVGAAPIPTIAPDGEGGVIAEWKSAGRRTVRLVIPANQDRKSYVYSRGIDKSQIDYSVSGLVLAGQLCSLFPD
jgi:hypothetical protein